MAEQLKYDLSQVLTAKIDFVNDPVYHDKIILEDNIRSILLNTLRRHHLILEMQDKHLGVCLST